MRAALWFIALFGVASAVALFASSNGSTVTIYWPPYRLDLSLNLVVLALLFSFGLVHLALRTVSLLTALPGRARDWRAARHERAMQADFLDGLVYLMTGRYSRARKAAEQTLVHEANLRSLGKRGGASARLQVMAHLMAAQSAQALQDVAGRDAHVSAALEHADSEEVGGSQEAVMLRAAHWSLQERDINAAQRWLDQLPSGVGRRTLALRLRLRLARLTRHGPQALETTRLLAKHKAFSALQARSLLRALIGESVLRCADPVELASLWDTLDAAERDLPEVACQAAVQWVRLGGDPSTALRWLMPVWQRMADHGQALESEQQQQLIHALESAFDAGACSSNWLALIEGAHKQWPADPALQYLAGVACWHAQLWGKAQQAIEQALPRLQHPYLQARAWYVLADLAQRRDQPAEAAEAWRKASSQMLQAQRPAWPLAEADPI